MTRELQIHTTGQKTGNLVLTQPIITNHNVYKNQKYNYMCMCTSSNSRNAPSFTGIKRIRSLKIKKTITCACAPLLTHEKAHTPGIRILNSVNAPSSTVIKRIRSLNQETHPLLPESKKLGHPADFTLYIFR